MDCPGAQRQKIADEIWGIMQADTSFKMDISHYNTLLRVYLDNAKDFSPQDILTELASNELAPNRVTYQHLIAKFCQVNIFFLKHVKWKLFYLLNDIILNHLEFTETYKNSVNPT